MLSNKFFIALVILSGLLFSSCDKEPEKNAEKTSTLENIDDPEIIKQKAEVALKTELDFAYKGFFDADSIAEIACGSEVSNENEWGIKFYLLREDKDALENVFETDLLQGSFNESLVQKIKFPTFGYELLYYNSLGYFLGSGGGEVYSYIIDFGKKEVYYAHLIADTEAAADLYISDNVKLKEIKNLFISNFKRDYPILSLIGEDRELKY